MQTTSTKLLVIAITTASIISAVTTITMSAATPAFAKINCNEDNTVCTGGAANTDCEGITTICTGGDGRRQTLVPGNLPAFSGGGGGQVGPFLDGETIVGGGGNHRICEVVTCSVDVGGSGQHLKGPGGNSGN